MKSWREIALPHHDVLSGTLKQSEFAADISEVLKGTAPEIYQKPEMFFSRTFITAGMHQLLVSVLRRLASGKDGDPVVQLQTNFGGGKTHTLLAVYHLATCKTDFKLLKGIKEIMGDAGVDALPQAKIAVIDGNDFSADQPIERDGIKINTLWGYIAYQLLGKAGYELVKQSDIARTAPGKEVFVQLLKNASPCVILMDELVALYRQLDESIPHNMGSFGANMSFIQILTESVKIVPNAMLLATLPSSDVEAAGNLGKLALETLEKYFGRLESVWKPVSTDESFEIVRRRLFEKIGDEHEMESVCREFDAMYHSNQTSFPIETKENSYSERLRKSYPIHPEFFDRLYKDWSTLQNFQRTRGVLQLLAILIQHLWNSDNRDAMIMPASVLLSDPEVRTKCLKYLPNGWDPIVTGEIDGPDSVAVRIIDGQNPRFGSVRAACRVARSIFFATAPMSDSISILQTAVRGIDREHILLACAQPGDDLTKYKDALDHLSDKLHYLFCDDKREYFWFDTRPNLRREMESRKERLNDSDVLALIKKYVVAASPVSGGFFEGIHPLTNIGDIPDVIGRGPTLVILPANGSYLYQKNNTSELFKQLEIVMEQRGDQPRSYRNRLLFLALDFNSASRLCDCARTLHAWRDISSDIESGRMNLGTQQVRQVKDFSIKSEEVMKRAIIDGYCHLLIPSESAPRKISFIERKVSALGSNISSAAEQVLLNNQDVVRQWSPIMLKKVLEKFYFKNGSSEVRIKTLWEDLAKYLYLPRIKDVDVFLRTIEQGISSKEYFAYAADKNGDQYVDFKFGTNTGIFYDESGILISVDAANSYQEQLDKKLVGNGVSAGDDNTPSGVSTPKQGAKGSSTATDTPKSHRFFGQKELDTRRGGMECAQIIENIIAHLEKESNVKITIDIEAESPNGFSEAVVRTVKENSNQLGLKNYNFEES